MKTKKVKLIYLILGFILCPFMLAKGIYTANEGATIPLPLHDAIEKRAPLKVIKDILDKGANINARDEYGNTPLHLATCNLYLEISRLLLDRGAEVDAKDNNGETALYSCSDNRHDEILPILQLLLDKGADINCTVNDGTTPLFRAAEAGYQHIVRLLLENKANVDAKTNDGWTPLNIAVVNANPLDIGTKQRPYDDNRRLVSIQLLLQYGADVNTKSNDGWTPANGAEFNNNLKVMELLCEKDATNTP